MGPGRVVIMLTASIAAALAALLAAMPHARATEHGVSIGVPALYTSVVHGPWRLGPALQYDLTAGGDEDEPDWFHLGAGLRGLFPVGGATVPVETYTQLHLVGAIGPWRPAAGPELGLTGLFRPEPRLRDSFILTGMHDEPEGFAEQRDDPGPLYLAFTASPIRFAIGAFTLDAAAFHLGTSVIEPGSAFRFQLEIARVGWTP